MDDVERMRIEAYSVPEDPEPTTKLVRFTLQATVTYHVKIEMPVEDDPESYIYDAWDEATDDNITEMKPVAEDWETIDYYDD